MIVERKDQDPKYMWDIKSMYESEEVWNRSYEEINKRLPGLAKHSGQLLSSGKNLLTALKDLELISREVENLYVYSHMNLDQDTRVPESQAMDSRAGSLMVKFMQATSFIEPELMGMTAEIWEGFKQEVPELVMYNQMMDDLMRKKPHVLDKDQEKILASFGEVLNAPSKTYSMFNNADMTFPKVEDSQGRLHDLTQGSYIPLVESKDRLLRKNAFETLYKSFKQYENTLTTTLYGEVKGNQVVAALRNFETARAASLFVNNIPESVYDALIEAVHDNMDIMYDYMGLRKKALGLDELHMYDIYTPMVDHEEVEIPYEKALEMIEKALQPLGEEYVNVAMHGFKDGWVDVYENPGKRSGAYSSGSYDSKPFILLNYKGTLDNVFTIIHEMGHSMHSYLTRENQPYVYGNYGIFLAEIASTCNELLLLHSLMAEYKDDEVMMRQLINHYLESFRTTVYRQTMFAEFEHDLNEQMQKGGDFTAAWLNKRYGELNRLYYGDHVVVDELIQQEWQRIPHFYYNYYVFQYATGFCAAVTFSERILNEGEKAVEDYLNFLKAGSSAYAIEVLKEAGVDMTDSKVVNYALGKFRKLVKEMEKMMA